MNLIPLLVNEIIQAMNTSRILIIRMSSLGDIAQCLSAVAALRRENSKCEIHWVVREDFKEFLDLVSDIDQLWVVERKKGIRGLLDLAKRLSAQDWDLIYDAHNNLRSRILSLFLKSKRFIRRPKNRWKRFLLFRLRKNTFAKPFRAQASFLEPLNYSYEARPLSWDFQRIILPALPVSFSKYVVLAPSAAWPLKRWPVEYWRQLVQQWTAMNFIVVGGPQDGFCEKIAQAAPDRVVNLAGQVSFAQSIFLVHKSKAVISNDTGILHIADVMLKPLVAIIGPSAFGYPSHPLARIAEIELPCKPCSKDGRTPCRNKTYQKCLIDLHPNTVHSLALEIETHSR